MAILDGNWDERCPHCKRLVIEELCLQFQADYETTFDFDCPHCGARIYARVHTVPQFETSTTTLE